MAMKLKKKMPMKDDKQMGKFAKMAGMMGKKGKKKK